MSKKAKTTTPPDVATLTKAQAKVEHKRLALEIEGHDKHYYQDDAPKISDAAYDALRQRVNAIEARFPELVTTDSPTQKVGVAQSRFLWSSTSRPYQEVPLDRLYASSAATGSALGSFAPAAGSSLSDLFSSSSIDGSSDPLDLP